MRPRLNMDDVNRLSFGDCNLAKQWGKAAYEHSGQDSTSRRVDIGRLVAFFGTHRYGSVRHRRSAPGCHLRRERWRARQAAWSRRRRGVQTKRAVWLLDPGADSGNQGHRCDFTTNAANLLPSYLPPFRRSAFTLFRVSTTTTGTIITLAT